MSDITTPYKEYKDIVDNIRPWGVDLSSWNCSPHVAHDPDFAELAAAGASFVFVKRGQGTNYFFPKYAQLLEQASQAGLLTFDYYYLSYDALPAAQLAAYQASRICKAQPAFDFENWSDGGSTVRRSREYMRAWGHDFGIQIRSAFGVAPIVYSYWDFLADVEAPLPDDPFLQCPLWIADYRPTPRVPAPWNFYTFHQRTSVGIVPGIAGVVDVDIFNGDISHLRKLARV